MPLRSRQQVTPQQPASSDTNSVMSIDIREVKPPIALSSNWVWPALALTVATLVALAVYLWIRSRRRTKPQVEIRIPPHIVARDRLRAALALIGQPEPFCVEVSQIVRTYMEQQFNLHAPERTTEEFLAELQDSSLLSLDQKRSLADFLMRCDLVKFARYEPGEPELRDLYDAAVRLIEETQWVSPVQAQQFPGGQQEPVVQPEPDGTQKSIVT